MRALERRKTSETPRRCQFALFLLSGLFPLFSALLAAIGVVCFAVGGDLVAAALAGALPWWLLHAGWASAGLGMGLTHQDTIIRCVTAPGELGLDDDGISAARAATAVTVASNAGGAALGTLVTAGAAPSATGVEEGLAVPVVAALTLMLALTPLLARRAA